MLDDDPLSADEDVARLRLVLRNTDLATLEEYGLLVYDRDENLVRKGPRFDAITPLWRLPDDGDEKLPDDVR